MLSTSGPIEFSSPETRNFVNEARSPTFFLLIPRLNQIGERQTENIFSASREKIERAYNTSAVIYSIRLIFEAPSPSAPAPSVRPSSANLRPGVTASAAAGPPSSPSTPPPNNTLLLSS